MMKRLWFCLLLGLSGCFFVLDDGSYGSAPDDYYYSSDLWFNDAWVSCSYDPWSEYSDWHFVALVESGHGPDEIYAVDVVIKDLSYYGADETVYLYDTGNGVWETTFSSWYYTCNYPYDFRFIAYDYHGYSTDAWVSW